MESAFRRAIAAAALALAIVSGLPASPAGETVLKWPSIWVGRDSKAPAVEAIVASFNAAHTGRIRVEVEPQPDYNAYEQKVRTALAANQAPGDIFTLKLNATTVQFYDSPQIMDLTREFTGEWRASFDAGAVAQSTINRRLKTLPLETAILPIWYNMDAMRAAGVTAPPRNATELWAALDRLKASGVHPMSQMSGDTNAWTSMIWFSHFAVSLGGTRVWERPFTDRAFVEAARILQRIFREYTTPDAVGAAARVSAGHFVSGRTAIFANGPWFAGRADLRAAPFINSILIAHAPAVGPNEGIMISRLQANIALAATRDRTRREAALTFLRYLTSPANVARIAETSGAMFAVRTGFVPQDPLQRQFYDIAAAARTTAADLEAALGSEATLEFAQQLGALALGRITPEEFCALVERRIDR
ncbi:MAG TPA: ABC transporter substrate-binding protein [Magnetospirillaceae bacterium]|nr:ABC transporter substrate-binding protein [Magnetospirillaceae bacterium]